MRKYFLLIIGSLTWSLTMVKSGLVGEYGLGFWGPNGHDGIWHLALIEGLARGSFSMPVFAGEIIKNYHLGFDILVFGLSQITGISSSILYFQIIPVILAVLIGFLSFSFIKSWSKSDVSAWWGTFFVYFAGSFSWIIGAGESHFWAQQSISTLVNPPYALSLVILLLGILSLHRKKYYLAIICFILLPHIKVYAGLLAFLGLAVGGLKERSLWKVLLVSLIISTPIFLLVSPNSQGLIIFRPGWFLESLFAPDRLNMPRIFSALNTFRVGQIWHKAIPAFGFAFIVFWIGNMGLRLLKEFILIKWLKAGRKLTWVEYFISSIIIAGGVIPMLFVQAGTAWNTIQFFYYSLFFSSILTGLSIAYILKYLANHKVAKISFCAIVILLSVPTNYLTLNQYLPSRPPAKLDLVELKALTILSKQPYGTVLTVPYDINLANSAINNPPRPLYLYESTAYVSVYSGQPTYLADEVNLNITNYNWQSRRDQNLNFFNLEEAEQINFLRKNSIKYLYLVGRSNFQLPLSKLELLYSEANVLVFKFVD